MEFFDIKAGANKNGAKPSVRATQKTIIISIPRQIADGCGLDQSNTVRVQYGQGDDKAAIRVSPDPAGKWKMRQGAQRMTLYVPEIMPQTEELRAAIGKGAMLAEFEADDRAVTIALPAPWRLANDTVLVRPPARRGAK